jgi:hypothetical protein
MGTRRLRFMCGLGRSLTSSPDPTRVPYRAPKQHLPRRGAADLHNQRPPDANDGARSSRTVRRVSQTAQPSTPGPGSGERGLPAAEDAPKTYPEWTDR